MAAPPTVGPFQFAAPYIDTKQASGFSFLGQQQFALMQENVAYLMAQIASLQAQVKALTP